MSTIKNAALFVDFDNIYTTLRVGYDKPTADTFANTPIHWSSWIESLVMKRLYPDPICRRFLKKVCFINSGVYPKAGTNFAKAGFRVVDCPQVTAQGKTSADMHIVIDIMDTLNHTTHYDEFFILSGDCDFAPIAMRLREHARNVIILPVGNVATAYTSTASWRIREDWFIKTLTGVGEMREVPTVIDDRSERVIVRPHDRSQQKVAQEYTSTEEPAKEEDEKEEVSTSELQEIEDTPTEVQEFDEVPETKVIENYAYKRLPIRVLPENHTLLVERDVIKVGMYADFSRLFPNFSGELAEHVEFRSVIVQVSTYDNSVQERYEIAPEQNIVGALKPDKRMANWNVIESYLQCPVSKETTTLDGETTELFRDISRTEDLYLAIEVSSAIGIDFEKAKQVFCKGTAKLVVRDKHSLNGAPAKFRKLAHGQFSHRCKILGYRIAFFGRVAEHTIKDASYIETEVAINDTVENLELPVQDAMEEVPVHEEAEVLPESVEVNDSEIPEETESVQEPELDVPSKTESVEASGTVIPLDNFDEALPIEKSILVKLCEENPKISLASASLKAPITFRVVDDRGASRSVHAWTVKFLEKYHIKTLKALLEIDVDTFNKLKQEKLVYAKAIVFTFTKLGFEFPFDTGISPSERIGWNLK